MKTILATSAAAILAASAAQAAAQDIEPRSVVVSYADLDLRRPAGREALERRVAAAVRRVCSTPVPSRDLAMLDLSRRCRVKAMADARLKLAQVYDERSLAEAATTMAAAKP